MNYWNKKFSIFKLLILELLFYAGNFVQHSLVNSFVTDPHWYIFQDESVGGRNF